MRGTLSAVPSPCACSHLQSRAGKQGPCRIGGSTKKGMLPLANLYPPTTSLTLTQVTWTGDCMGQKAGQQDVFRIVWGLRCMVPWREHGVGSAHCRVGWAGVESGMPHPAHHMRYSSILFTVVIHVLWVTNIWICMIPRFDLTTANVL
jgi:hypothetical protein